MPGKSPSKIKLKCPICKKRAARGSEDFPFCSERCRAIDLGKWASGQYVISSPVLDIEDKFLDQAARGSQTSGDENED